MSQLSPPSSDDPNSLGEQPSAAARRSAGPNLGGGYPRPPGTYYDGAGQYRLAVPAARPKNSLAVASMICGIAALGFICTAVFPLQIQYAVLASPAGIGVIQGTEVPLIVSACLMVPSAAAALITGLVALKHIRPSGGMVGGRGMALSGIWLAIGAFGLALGVIALYFLFALLMMAAG